MRGARGRRLAVLSSGAGILVLLVAGYLCRRDLEELWWISRLRANDPKARLAAAKRLGEIGSDRAARALLLTLREGSTLGDWAAGELGMIYPRVSSACRMRVIEGLFERLQGGFGEFVLDGEEEPGRQILVQVLGALKPVPVEGYPLLVKALRSAESADPAAQLLARGWPGSREAISGFLAESAPQVIARFYSTLGGKPPPLEELALEIPRFFALNHEKPEARALALSFVEDPAILKEVFLHDSSRIPRIAAIRIAGYLGDIPEYLDLTELLLKELDQHLLREIIQARTLWSHTRPALTGLELWDGSTAICMHRQGSSRPWGKKELERLVEILGKPWEPALRDAASLALSLANEETPEQFSDFRVHEWGVWVDGGSAFVPPAKLLGDLPSFVHRSEISADGLLRARTPVSYPAMDVTKPVIFFYAPRPLCVDLRVSFREGRPWTFFPDVTDYSGNVGGAAADAAQNSSPAPSLDDQGTRPPWLHGIKPEGVLESDLRSRYQVAPWLFPKALPLDGALSGMGLEWRGLRIGYGKPLEGEFKPVDDGSWWARLREVPSSPVALRGDHEKFLFYDGAIRLPSPVQVRWAGKEKQALSLQVRSFEEYPVDLDQIYERDMMPPTEYLPGVVVVRKEKNRPPSGRLVRRPPPGKEPIRVPLESLHLEGDTLRKALETLLEEEGLTPKETRALLQTWEREFFATDGLRVISVLPRWLYDAMLPLEIHPLPQELVRVGLVWKECQGLEDANREAESKVIAQPAPEPLQVLTSKLEIRREPLELGPAEPFKIGADGRLTGLQGLDQGILISGSGRRISIPRGKDSWQEIHLADLETRKVRRAARCRSEGIIVDYSLSADGERLGFVAEEGKGITGVYVADVRRRVLLEVLKTVKGCTFSYLSGDGKILSFLEDSTPRIVDLDTGESVTPRFSGSDNCQSPVLSLDGTKVLLQSAPNGWESPARTLVLDLRQRTQVLIGSSTWGSNFPTLSSDGRRVLHFDRDANGSGLASVLDSHDGCRLGLGRCRGGPFLPALSSDGSRVLLAYDHSFWTVDVETGVSRRVFTSDCDIGEASASSDCRRVVFLAQDPQGEGSRQIHVLDLPAD